MLPDPVCFGGAYLRRLSFPCDVWVCVGYIPRDLHCPCAVLRPALRAIPGVLRGAKQPAGPPGERAPPTPTPLPKNTHTHTHTHTHTPTHCFYTPPHHDGPTRRRFGHFFPICSGVYLIDMSARVVKPTWTRAAFFRGSRLEPSTEPKPASYGGPPAVAAAASGDRGAAKAGGSGAGGSKRAIGCVRARSRRTRWPNYTSGEGKRRRTEAVGQPARPLPPPSFPPLVSRARGCSCSGT